MLPSTDAGVLASRADGTLLYASDHDGVFAIFPIEQPMTGP